MNNLAVKELNKTMYFSLFHLLDNVLCCPDNALAHGFYNRDNREDILLDWQVEYILFTVDLISQM